MAAPELMQSARHAPAVSEAKPAGFRIVPSTDREMAAVRRFNERMRAADGPTDFLLPDQPNPAVAPGTAPPVAWTKYVVLDSDDEVRGGFLLMTQPGWLNGRDVTVANYQAPLSEGIHDKRFAIVGMQMLRHVQRKWPLSFVVGMGHIDRPLPRLLAAAAWKVSHVPWLFRMARPARVMRELPMLRARAWTGLGARLAAASGAAWLGAQALHARRWTARREARRFSLEMAAEWGPWADDLWERTREHIAFAVSRDRRTLDGLYPPAEGRYLIYTLRDGADTVAWAVCFATQMRGHSHFGNLRVATVLDALGLPHAMPALASHVAEALTDLGADLIMTNQSLPDAIHAFKRTGFVAGPSNYLFAASRALSDAVAARADALHMTRGDGDGRIHL